MTSFRFVPLLFVALLSAAPAGAASPTPVGVWLHANKRFEIAIAPCGERLCATVVWLKKPNGPDGLPRVDVENPDPALRTRQILGLTVLRDLRRTGENSWEDGKVYNPDDGSAYQAGMSITSNGDLSIRAYVLVSLLGHTLIWTRVPG